MSELSPKTAEAKDMELAATRRRKKSTNIPGVRGRSPNGSARDKPRLITVMAKVYPL